MQIVIDIPDYIIAEVKEWTHISPIKLGIVEDAIKDGKVLPKGHGRLIEADIRTYVNNYIETLDKRYGKVPLKNLPTWKHCELRTMLFHILNEIDHAPTIIEADDAERR